MIYDIILTLLTISIVCNVILIISNFGVIIVERKHKKGKFIKRIERDTKDLEVDNLIKELDKYDDEKGIFRKIKRRIFRL